MLSAQHIDLYSACIIAGNFARLSHSRILLYELQINRQNIYNPRWCPVFACVCVCAPPPVIMRIHARAHHTSIRVHARAPVRLHVSNKMSARVRLLCNTRCLHAQLNDAVVGGGGAKAACRDAHSTPAQRKCTTIVWSFRRGVALTFKCYIAGDVSPKSAHSLSLLHTGETNARACSAPTANTTSRAIAISALQETLVHKRVLYLATSHTGRPEWMDGWNGFECDGLVRCAHIGICCDHTTPHTQTYIDSFIVR